MKRQFAHRLDGLGEVAAYGNGGLGRLFLVLGLSVYEEHVLALVQIEPWHLPLAGYFLSLVNDFDLENRHLEVARLFLPIVSAEQELQFQ